jgi:hypothetical protein
MANTQIILEIETGAGSRVLVANVGYFNSSYQPLYNICFGGRSTDFFHNLTAEAVIAELKSAIESLKTDRSSYLGLTPIEQGYRLSILELCLKLKDLCIKHPNAVVSLAP